MCLLVGVGGWGVYKARDKGISAQGVICVPLKFIMCSDSEAGEAKLKGQTTKELRFFTAGKQGPESIITAQERISNCHTGSISSHGCIINNHQANTENL